MEQCTSRKSINSRCPYIKFWCLIFTDVFLGFNERKIFVLWLLYSGFFVNIMFILSRVITTVNDIQDMKCQVSIPLSPLSNLYFKKLKPSSLFNIQWPHNILNKSKSHWVSCQRVSLFIVVFTTVGYCLALCTTEHNSSGDLLCCCSVLRISLSLFHSLRVCLGTHPGCFPLKTKQQTREFVRRPLFQKHSMTSAPATVASSDFTYRGLPGNCLHHTCNFCFELGVSFSNDPGKATGGRNREAALLIHSREVLGCRHIRCRGAECQLLSLHVEMLNLLALESLYYVTW